MQKKKITRRRFLELFGKIFAGISLAYMLGCGPKNYFKQQEKLSFEVVYPAQNKTAEGIALIIDQQLEKYGININLKSLETAYIQDLLGKKEFQIAISGYSFSGNINDLSYLFEIDNPATDYPEDAWNYSGIDDILIRNLFKELKNGKEVLPLIEKEFLDQQPLFFLYRMYRTFGCSSDIKIKPVEKVGLGYSFTRNANEWESDKKRINIALPTEINHLSIMNPKLEEEYLVFNLIYNGLLSFDEKGNLFPDLADNIKIEGNKVIVKIKDNVKWHDGRRFTVDDIIKSFEIYNKSDIFLDKDYVEAQLRKINSDTVEINYKDFEIFKLTLPILPPNYKEDNLIGTGPYKVAKLGKQEILLKANPEFYGKKANIDEILLSEILDLGTSTMMLLSGYVDISLLPSYDINKIRKKEFNIFSIPSNSFTYMVFNTKDKILRNKNIRKAICYLIDREKILAWTKNPGDIVEAPFIPSKKINPDPEKAKKLLEECGYKLSQ